MEWTVSPSNGASDGLISLWNKNAFHSNSQFIGPNYIVVEGLWVEKGTQVVIVKVYALCDRARMRNLWEELSGKMTNN